MEYISIIGITIICYVFGEVFKVLVNYRKEKYKYIPVIVSVVGGLIGIVLYITNKELLLNANNLFDAIVIGIISGSASTSSNEIIKKFIAKEKGK